MTYLLLREAGGLGDLLQVGSVARCLADHGAHTVLFTLKDAALLALAELMPDFTEVHGLQLRVNERRPRGETQYVNFPYLQPVLGRLGDDVRLIDLFCPAWKRERWCAREGGSPRLSRAQIFALAAVVPPWELLPPRLLLPPADPFLTTMLTALPDALEWTILAPGSKDPARALPPSLAKALAARMVDEFGPLILFGYPDVYDVPGAFLFPKHVPGGVSRAQAVHAAMYLFARARLVVTVDAFPLHLAATLGVPTVVLCGPTDPNSLTAHYRGVVWPEAKPGIRCRACYYQARRGFSPTCRTDSCAVLRAIDPNSVIEKAREMCPSSLV